MSARKACPTPHLRAQRRTTSERVKRCGSNRRDTQRAAPGARMGSSARETGPEYPKTFPGTRWHRGPHRLENKTLISGDTTPKERIVFRRIAQRTQRKERRRLNRSFFQEEESKSLSGRRISDRYRVLSGHHPGVRSHGPYAALLVRGKHRDGSSRAASGSACHHRRTDAHCSLTLRTERCHGCCGGALRRCD